MLAYFVTFLAGVVSAFLSKRLFRAFASPSKEALPTGTAAMATEATSAASESSHAGTPERARPALTITLAADPSHGTPNSKRTSMSGGGVTGASSPAAAAAAARLLAKQASVNRSRAAIQVLHEAADLLRAQGDAMAAASDEGPPSPEPHEDAEATAAAAAVAVQRFLTRKLSRQTSRVSSSGAPAQRPTDVEANIEGGAAA